MPVGVPRLLRFGYGQCNSFPGLGIPPARDRHFSFVEAVLPCSALSLTCMVAAQK